MNKLYGTIVEVFILIKNIPIFSKCCWTQTGSEWNNLLLEAIKFMFLHVTS